MCACLCVCARDVCTFVYTHACRVHACVMPYFDLAVYMFIVGSAVFAPFLGSLDNYNFVGSLMCVRVCACLNCHAFLRHSSILLLTFMATCNSFTEQNAKLTND